MHTRHLHAVDRRAVGRRSTLEEWLADPVAEPPSTKPSGRTTATDRQESSVTTNFWR